VRHTARARPFRPGEREYRAKQHHDDAHAQRQERQRFGISKPKLGANNARSPQHDEYAGRREYDEVLQSAPHERGHPERDKATTGSATPFAWVASAVGLFGITVGTLYQKRFGGEIDWRPALCVQYAAAGLLFAFGAAVFETGVVDWTPQFLFALGWLVLVLSFGAVWLLYFLIRRAAVTRVASLFYLTPPVTALMAWALFNERLAPRALLGMAVCVLGVFLVNWKLKEI
jgi:drug/metabolite transporter (DMT)-like permease